MKTTRTASVLLLLALGLTGCDPGRMPLPSAPSAVGPVVNTSGPRGYVADITLSGVVCEITPTGLDPLEGATIYCDACGEQGHTWAYTTSNGFYTFTGLWTTSGQTVLSVTKQGYDDPPGQPTLASYEGPGWRAVTLDGATQFDMQLVRR